MIFDDFGEYLSTFAKLIFWRAHSQLVFGTIGFQYGNDFLPNIGHIDIFFFLFLHFDALDSVPDAVLLFSPDWAFSMLLLPIFYQYFGQLEWYYLMLGLFFNNYTMIQTLYAKTFSIVEDDFLLQFVYENYKYLTFNLDYNNIRFIIAKFLTILMVFY